MENQGFNEQEDGKVETATEQGAGEKGQETGSSEGEGSEYKAKFLYIAAEMENMKKRFQREKEGLVKYANENLLSDVIEVVDNFERTMSALKMDTDEKMKNVVFGIEMIRKQFLDVLAKFGLKEIEAIGKMFDPNFHEGMAQEACEGKPDGEIIKEFQKGYILNGRLLRASKVVIVKN